MGILRVAAAVGALVWVAPNLPRTILQSLPEWKGDVAASAAQAVASSGAAGQVLASQAVALCTQNPERCASLLSAGASLAAVPVPPPHVEKPRPAHGRPVRAVPKDMAEAEAPAPKTSQRKP